MATSITFLSHSSNFYCPFFSHTHSLWQACCQTPPVWWWGYHRPRSHPYKSYWQSPGCEESSKVQAMSKYHAGVTSVVRWVKTVDIIHCEKYLHILSGQHLGWISWQGGWQGCSDPGRRCTGSCWGTTQSPTQYQWGSLLFYWDSRKFPLHYKDHQPPPS